MMVTALPQSMFNSIWFLTLLYPDQQHIFAFPLSAFPRPALVVVVRFSSLLPLPSVLPSILSQYYAMSVDASSFSNSTIIQ